MCLMVITDTAMEMGVYGLPMDRGLIGYGGILMLKKVGGSFWDVCTANG